MLDGSSQEEGCQADEGVDANFLVGPMELGPDGQMLIVLELPERGFRLGLAAVGGKDFLVRPAMAVGDEHPLAEMDFDFGPGLLVDGPGEAVGARLGWVEGDLEEVLQVLAPLELGQGLGRVLGAGLGLCELFTPSLQVLDPFGELLPQAAPLGL